MQPNKWPLVFGAEANNTRGLYFAFVHIARVFEGVSAVCLRTPIVASEQGDLTYASGLTSEATREGKATTFW